VRGPGTDRRGEGWRLAGLLALALLLFCPEGTGAQGGSRRRAAQPDTTSAYGVGLGGGLLTVEAFYTGEVIANLDGGIASGTAWRGVADLMFTVDPTPLWGVSGTRVGVDLIGIHGDPPGGLTGDWQGVSDIAAPRTLRIYELWLRQQLIPDRLSLLAGIYDVNTTFDVLETATLFLNSSSGMGPDFAAGGPNGAPTYPYPGLSLLVQGSLSDHFELSALLADGVPGDPDDAESTQYRIEAGEGALIGSELAWVSDREGLTTLPPVATRWNARRRRAGAHAGWGSGTAGRWGAGGWGRQRGRPPVPEPAPSGLPGTGALHYGKVALGLWRSTSRFTLPPAGGGPGDTLVREGSWGGYLLAERIVVPDRTDPQRMVGIFLRLGAADQRVEEIDRYVGCGVMAARRLAGARQALLGLALSAARLGRNWADRLGVGQGADRWEVAAELTIRLQVGKRWALQPDLQYIVHPGFTPDRPHALAVGLRLELNG